MKPEPTPSKVVEVAFGAEASRRVAWAKYYEATEQLEKLLKLNSLMEERLAELVILIAENEPLQVLEPEGALIQKARSVLATLRLRPRGQAAVRKVQYQMRKEAHQ